MLVCRSAGERTKSTPRNPKSYVMSPDVSALALCANGPTNSPSASTEQASAVADMRRTESHPIARSNEYAEGIVAPPRVLGPFVRINGVAAPPARGAPLSGSLLLLRALLCLLLLHRHLRHHLLPFHGSVRASPLSKKASLPTELARGLARAGKPLLEFAAWDAPDTSHPDRGDPRRVGVVHRAK